MLAARVDENGKRIETMDQQGTRGAAPLALQISELSKDLVTLAEQLHKHQTDHTEENSARITRLRWLIMAVIAAIAVIETPVLYIAAHIR